ncbi:MAG: hypothetical protein V4561_00985 [Bacteroidota bacterium]
MRKLFFTLMTFSCLNLFFSSCENSNPNANHATDKVSDPFDSARCFLPEGIEMCLPQCLEIIVDAHKITDQQSIVARVGITTIPYEITTQALRDSIGDRRCSDKWRIKLDTAENHVTFLIQDSANAPGYFSSALITGILEDRRTESEEPVKFTFYEARDTNDSLHFIFDVLYPNTHVQFYNVSDLPTSGK